MSGQVAVSISQGRAGRPWERVKAQVFREETICWLCLGLVDQSLDPRSPWSRTADHKIQLQHGGRPIARDNLALSHRRCNSARSNALRGLAREACACSLGLPCARLQPRGYVSVDPYSV